MSSKMLIFTACFFIGLSHNSWSVLGDEIVPRGDMQPVAMNFSPADYYEIVSDSELAMRRVHDSILEQIDSFHDYMTGKMTSLEAACKKNKTTEGNEYHTTGPFQSHVVNKLVEIMTEKIEDVGEIFVEDLLLISQNASEVIEESLEERVNRLGEAFDNMDNQVETLAKKGSVVQVKESISNLFVSSIAGLQEQFQDMVSQLEVNLMAGNLMNHTKTLESELKTDSNCQTSNVLLEESLQKTSMTTLKVSEIKTNWLSNKSNSSCSVVPEQRMTILDLAAKENKDSIQTLSAVLQDTDSKVSNLLDDLVLELKSQFKESRFRPVSSPAIIPVSPTEHAIIEADSSDDPACLDSTFISLISPPDICGAAVQLDRCLKEYLSFHCCRTCRRAGYSFKVPDLGASRLVPVIEALNAVQPSAEDLIRATGTTDPVIRKMLRTQEGLYANYPITG